MKPLNILISLHKGYGVGDCAQVSAVLRHVKKYRPNWTVDYQAEAGRYCIGNGLVSNCFEFGKNPNPNKNYDGEVLICLYDTFAGWHDRPSTRVSSTLHEKFDIKWDAECGRYQVNVSSEAMDKARALLQADLWAGYPKFVAVHYRGDSSPDKKNLTHDQANKICKCIEELDHVPVILDWRKQSQLDYRRITTPQDWGNNIEMVTALISHCKAFVGIDSGPSKCASATDVPSLVTWVGHHPAQFYDPAPNTTHLVPTGYHGLFPVCNDKKVIEFFESNYLVRQYNADPVNEIRKWLKEVLI